MEWPHQKTMCPIGAVIHKQGSTHKVPKSVLQTVIRKMQFTLHATRRRPHRALRLVQAMSAWPVKTRRAPFRHSRDARVNGHTTTAMHKLSTPSPPPPLPPTSNTGAVNSYHQYSFIPRLFTGHDPTRGSGQEGFHISRVGPGRVKTF